MPLFSIPLDGVAATPPVSTPAGRLATRGCATRLTPPTVEEIIAVMRYAGDNRHGWRLRALIVVLWRGGLRIEQTAATARVFAGSRDHLDRAINYE